MSKPAVPAPIRPPAEIAHLTELLGVDATLLLIEEHGGTRLHIPQNPNQGSSISRLVGLPGAKALAARYGRTPLHIPLARHWRARVYREQGATYRDIARRLGISESTVHGYLQASGMTARAEQLDLFPPG